MRAEEVTLGHIGIEFLRGVSPVMCHVNQQVTGSIIPITMNLQVTGSIIPITMNQQVTGSIIPITQDHLVMDNLSRPINLTLKPGSNETSSRLNFPFTVCTPTVIISTGSVHTVTASCSTLTPRCSATSNPSPSKAEAYKFSPCIIPVESSGHLVEGLSDEESGQQKSSGRHEVVTVGRKRSADEPGCSPSKRIKTETVSNPHENDLSAVYAFTLDRVQAGENFIADNSSILAKYLSADNSSILAKYLSAGASSSAGCGEEDQEEEVRTPERVPSEEVEEEEVTSPFSSSETCEEGVTDRKAGRRERNRDAARRCRAKKKTFQKQMSQEFEEEMRRNTELKTTLKNLEQEVTDFRKLLLSNIGLFKDDPGAAK